MQMSKLRRKLGLMVSGFMIFSCVLSYSVVKAEEATYDTANITNGYGVAGKAGVSVTIGATADVNVNIKVKTITQEDLVDFVKTHQSLFTSDELNTITQNSSYTNAGLGARLLCGIFGASFGKGNSNYYRNAVNQKVEASTSEDKELLKELHEMTEQEYTLSGNLKAVGQSYVPTVAYAFVEVTRIQFSDGKTLKVINKSPVIAEPDGTRDGVKGDESNEDLVLIPLN